MSNVCFDKTFLILIIVVILIIILYKYNQSDKHNTQCPIQQPIQSIQTMQPMQPMQQPATIIRPNIRVNINRDDIIQNDPPVGMMASPPVDPIRVFDYRNIDDVLTGPIRRPTRDQIGPYIGNPLLNIYTQGPPDNYSWVGILLATDASGVATSFGMLKLFGRQKYTNSNTWQYYVLAHNGGHDKIKIALDDKYRKELYDDDTVIIPELNRTYKVKLNKEDWLSYNPDLY